MVIAQLRFHRFWVSSEGMRTHGDWHGRGSSGLADGSNRTRQFITRSPTRAPPPHQQQQQQQLVLARKREGDDGAACNKQQGMLNYWDLSKHELALSHLDVSPFLTPTDKLASAPADRSTDAMQQERSASHACARISLTTTKGTMHRIIHAPAAAAGGQNYKSKRTSYRPCLFPCPPAARYSKSRPREAPIPSLPE